MNRSGFARGVLLVSMPFGALERQALGLSLLKARLREQGVHCDIRYFTFAFADLIGVEDYRWISTDFPYTAFVGDWIFVRSLYGNEWNSGSSYVQKVLRQTWQIDELSIRRILRIKDMAACFIDYCLNAIDWRQYLIVGFTSTFEQNIASLSLAKRIKNCNPEIKIVFGGANWEGEMGEELLSRFPFVDYALSGEADESFPRLAKSILRGRNGRIRRNSIPGLIYRSKGGSISTSAPRPVPDLDSLPIPDYTDYFHDLSRSSAASDVVPILLFETSRGCWWGAKHHCTFCGLNGANLCYRSKSAQRALRELDILGDRWRAEMFQAVDNVISMTYFNEFFPALKGRNAPFRLFYEIRANLRRDQVRTLREAGVFHVQPGIESLNDHILQLMHKGTTALQNIQVLRWCKEYGVYADWNLLYGFPGETADDYNQLLRLLPSIRFLGPPTACGPVRLDRFSPYFDEAGAYGLVDLHPLVPYRYLYPFPEESVARIAYYFDYSYAPGAHIVDRSRELTTYVNGWQAQPERGMLWAEERHDGSTVLTDTRSEAVRQNVVLRGIDGELYLYCDRARDFADIKHHLHGRFPKAVIRDDDLRTFLETLVVHKYMVEIGDRYLSLALHRDWPKITTGVSSPPPGGC